VGIKGVVEGIQKCFCLDIQKFEGHSTRVGLTPIELDTTKGILGKLNNTREMEGVVLTLG